MAAVAAGPGGISLKLANADDGRLHLQNWKRGRLSRAAPPPSAAARNKEVLYSVNKLVPNVCHRTFTLIALVAFSFLYESPSGPWFVYWLLNAFLQFISITRRVYLSIWSLVTPLTSTPELSYLQSYTLFSYSLFHTQAFRALPDNGEKKLPYNVPPRERQAFNLQTG